MTEKNTVSPRTVLKRFADGFKAELNPTMPPIDDPNIGGTGTADDLRDYASQDMIEKQNRYDLGLNADVEAEPVRTINNALDFLGDVGEGLLDMASHGHEGPVPAKDEPYSIRIFQPGTKAWTPTTYNVTGNNPQQIARVNEERSTMVIVNLGPEVVYISDESTPGVGAGKNSRGIPVSKLDGTGPYSPIQLDTQGEVWARPTTAAGVNTVEVTETYGSPEKHVF